MKEIYLLDDAVISPLGFSTQENLTALRHEHSGLKWHKNDRFPEEGFYAGIIEADHLMERFSEIGNPADFTKLEIMMLLAVHTVLEQAPPIDLTTTALIVSTTKGNIDLLSHASFPESRILLSNLAEVIKDFFKFKLQPIIISNACISGGLALAVAQRFINSGKFKHAVIVGGDLVSDFVIAGFQSFQAIADQPCQPFSANRNGISLGEAAAALLVSSQPPDISTNISLVGAASANDANHISAPSRTGEGLYKSIENALREAYISAREIDYISAHGTATLFNDEMEAVAFNRAHLQDVPVNSFKAWYGHTLGAAALVESIITRHSLLNDELFKSLNFQSLGTSQPLNILEKREEKKLKYALKTASGFGGCNLALIFKKEGNG